MTTDTPETPNNEALTQKLHIRLRGLTDYVRDCERRISMGEVVDMTGLDKNVGEVCQIVQDLPAEQGRSFEEGMSKLVKALDGLAEVLQAQQQG